MSCTFEAAASTSLQLFAHMNSGKRREDGIGMTSHTAGDVLASGDAPFALDGAVCAERRPFGEFNRCSRVQVTSGLQCM